MRNEAVPIHHKTNETSSPSITNDASEALSVGSDWFNKTTSRWYRCIRNISIFNNYKFNPKIINFQNLFHFLS